ncbi:MAG: hypothetical protein IJN96_05575 [Clostridia bacterium]|nr:hypothetical protein [Clostridia bacterium]
MRYKGYVVTYIGETKKVNNDNFFLNGFCKENIDESFLYDRNKEFRSRNLYAIASGAKCDSLGDELAYTAVDILGNFHVADFDSVNREFFHVLNTAVTSQVLERSDEHYELDMSILSIDRDDATVYNMGDLPVFYYENGRIRNLIGTPPQQVHLEKDYLDDHGVIKTMAVTRKNVSYIGMLDPETEVVPYTSETFRLTKKAFFVLCNKKVAEAVSEEDIKKVLEDKSIKNKHKALAILDKAIKDDPDGDYTVEVIVVNRGLAISETEMKGMGMWLVAAGLCVVLCYNGNAIIRGIAKISNEIKNFISEVSSEEVVSPAKDLKWVPFDQREKEETKEEEPVQEEIVEESVQTEEEVQPTAEPQNQQTAPAPATKKSNQNSGANKAPAKKSEPASASSGKSSGSAAATPSHQVQLPGSSTQAVSGLGETSGGQSQAQPAEPSTAQGVVAPTTGGNETPLDFD